MKNLNTRQKSKKFILVSIVFHIFVGFFFLNNKPSPKSPHTKSQTPIKINFLEPLQEKTSPQQIMQIVEQNIKKPLKKVELDPNKKRYLSEKDQTVVKETKAALSGEFKNSKQLILKKPTKKSIVKKQKNRPKNKLTKKSKHFKPKAKIAKKLDKKSLLMPLFQQKPPQDLSQNQNPSSQNFSRSSDHLKDITIGASTLLNTKEYKYYSYYQRIKKKIQKQWEPRIKHRIHAVLLTGRKPSSLSSSEAELFIVLNKFGKLQKIQLLGPSGLQDLDQSAVEAFKAAAPFPNPPQGMIDNTGVIKIKWSFVLEV